MILATLGTATLGAAALNAPSVAAQARLPTLPFADTPVRRIGDSLEVARVGTPHPQIQAWEARRRSARERGAERGRAALHAYLDAGFAVLPDATPQLAQAAHDLVEHDAELAAVRPLSEGAAVVVMRLPLPPLRRLGFEPSAAPETP